VIDEVGRKPSGMPQPLELSGSETRVFKVLQRLLKARSHKKAPVFREPSDKELVRGGAIQRLPVEAFQHRQHVEIGEENAVRIEHHNSKSTW
jgi:hypothetical protein